MKKLFATILVGSLSVVSVIAQPKDGYYRVQNAASNNYVSIVNNKVDDANKNSLLKGGGGYVYSLRIKPKEEVVSDPGSIIYLKKGASGYILENQGMNTYNLTSLYLQLFSGTQTLANGKVFGSTVSGAYWMYGSHSGVARYMFETKTKSQSDPDFVNGKTVYYHIANAVGPQGDWSVNDNEASWFFREIDNTNELFGITPTVQVGDKWYGTIYCSFPIEVSKDMNAYYIEKYSSGQSQAQIIKIEDGIVPAKTAVIIECTSSDPAKNLVTIKASNEVSKSYNSILKGEYFCYIPRKAANGKNENANMEVLKNAKVANSNIRVIGVADGKLALVKPTDNQLVVTDKSKYVPANTAFLEIVGSANTIELTTESLGINSILQDVEQTDIYNLQGQKVASKGTTIDELPRGLYIINGRKVIKD